MLKPLRPNNWDWFGKKWCKKRSLSAVETAERPYTQAPIYQKGAYPTNTNNAKTMLKIAPFVCLNKKKYNRYILIEIGPLVLLQKINYFIQLADDK